jgi:hypothetical protein
VKVQSGTGVGAGFILAKGATLQLVVRLLVYLAIFCLPFVLLTLTSRQRDGLLWLMFPIFWVVPATIGALAVFFPTEAFFAARGLRHLSGVLVPLVGAMVGALIFLVYLVRSRSNAARYRGSPARNKMRGPQLIVALVLSAAVGAGWGALWRLSGWVTNALGLSGSA